MKKLITTAILIPSLCIIGSGCSSSTGKKMPVTPQLMSCAGNVPAQITLYSPTVAKLTFEDKSYDLNRIETASGVKYGNDDITYWNKGIDTLLTRKDGSMTTCTYIPKSGI